MTTHDFFTAITTRDDVQVAALLAADPALATVRADSGVSAVLLAMYYGADAVVATILTADPPLDVFDAAALGRVEELGALLAATPTLANAVATDGFSPLGLAAFFGQGDAVAMLLESGAAVNQASSNAQMVMPLHSAVAQGDVEIARMLIAQGALVNAAQQDSFAPLHEAAQNGKIPMIALLLESGAAINAPNTNGLTPLAMAEDAGKDEAADYLRQHGATR